MVALLYSVDRGINSSFGTVEWPKSSVNHLCINVGDIGDKRNIYGWASLSLTRATKSYLLALP